MAIEGTVTSGQHPVATSYTNKRLPHTDNIKIYQTSLMAPALRHTVLQTTKTTRFSSHFQSCLSLNFFIANARRPKKPRGFLSASLRPPHTFSHSSYKVIMCDMAFDFNVGHHCGAYARCKGVARWLDFVIMAYIGMCCDHIVLLSVCLCVSICVGRKGFRVYFLLSQKSHWASKGLWYDVFSWVWAATQFSHFLFIGLFESDSMYEHELRFEMANENRTNIVCETDHLNSMQFSNSLAYICTSHLGERKIIIK